MTPAARLAKAFELSEQSKRLFLSGLRARFPELNDQELHRLFLQLLFKCRDRNY